MFAYLRTQVKFGSGRKQGIHGASRLVELTVRVIVAVKLVERHGIDERKNRLLNVVGKFGPYVNNAAEVCVRMCLFVPSWAARVRPIC